MRARASFAALLCTLAPLALTACWPGAPIAALVAAGGGGGGGSGVARSIEGIIILENGSGGSTSVDWQLESEPNDMLGLSRPLDGSAAATTIVQGTTAFRRDEIRLIRDEDAQLLLQRTETIQELRELRALPTSRQLAQFAPGFLASGPRSLWLAEALPGTLRVRRQASVGGLPEREWETPLVGELTGFAALDGALVGLVQDARLDPAQALVGFDPDTGDLLFRRALDGEPLFGLTAGRFLVDGTEALFALGRTSEQVFRIELVGTADDRHIAEPRPIATVAGARALAFDGIMLQADTDDAAIWLDPRDGQLVGESMHRERTTTLAVAARVDLDTDTFHLRLEPGEQREVQLFADAESVHGASVSAHLLAFERDRVLAREPELWFHQVVDSNDRTPVEVLDGGPHGRTFELVVLGTRGRSDYRLVVGESRTPAPVRSTYSESEDARALLAALDDAGWSLWEPEDVLAHWADPTLPRHRSEEILVMPRDPSTEWTIERAADHLLHEKRRTPAGPRALRARLDPGAPAPRVQRIEGSVLPASAQREADRALCRALEELSRHPDVAWCEPNTLLRTLAEPNDPLWGPQRWYHETMELPAGWDITTGSSSVRIAVVDTGVRTENTDLAPTLVDGYDFVSDSGTSGDGDGLDSDPYDEGGFDSHGTHVAGSAAARGNNSLGVTGTMWQARVVPIRALDINGEGSTLDIAEAVRYAARLSNASGELPSARSDVINLSLGSTANSPTLESAIVAATSAGTVVLAAAGNSGEEGVLYPAAQEETIAIGASNIQDVLSSFSNWGPEIDVVAPGGDSGDRDSDGNPDQIYSTFGSPGGIGNGTYDFLAGTSMATGLASGCVGLILAVNSGLDPEGIRQVLTENAEDLGDPGRDDFYGHGLIDMHATLDNAAPVLDLPDDQVDFGINGTTLLLQASNAGSGTLQIEGLPIVPTIGSDASWLSARVLGDGRTIELTADRDGFADGDYQARMTVRSNGGDLDVLVDLTVHSGPLPDVGVVTIQLRNAGGEVLSSTTTDLGAEYAYRLDGVGTGPFFLRCGIDVDDDGVLCEPGEACGQYPDASDPALLDLSSLDSIRLDLLLEQ